MLIISIYFTRFNKKIFKLIYKYKTDLVLFDTNMFEDVEIEQFYILDS